MRLNQSWAIDKEVLESLPDETKIEIFDKDEKILYVTDAKTFSGGDLLEFGKQGKQYFLPLHKFKTEKTGRVLTKGVWVA